jgi:hypothetical protein
MTPTPAHSVIPVESSHSPHTLAISWILWPVTPPPTHLPTARNIGIGAGAPKGPCFAINSSRIRFLTFPASSPSTSGCPPHTTLAHPRHLESSLTALLLFRSVLGTTSCLCPGYSTPPRALSFHFTQPHLDSRHHLSCSVFLRQQLRRSGFAFAKSTPTSGYSSPSHPRIPSSSRPPSALPHWHVRVTKGILLLS